MHKIAKLVSLVLGFPWIIVLVYVVFSQAQVTREQLIPLASMSLFFHILIPFIYLMWAMKTGRVSDLDITKREQRYGILTVMILSYIASLFVTYSIGNVIVFHVLAIIVAYLAIVYVITFYWKISLHMGVNVLSVILINFFYDWKLSFLFLALPLIFWSRYTLKKHTPAQLLLGALVSGSVALGGLRIFGYLT